MDRAGAFEFGRAARSGRCHRGARWHRPRQGDHRRAVRTRPRSTSAASTSSTPTTSIKRWRGRRRSSKRSTTTSRCGPSAPRAPPGCAPLTGAWMDDVERAFREAHGPAIATLIRLFGDITLAEDAVQDAFAAAVHRWPKDGVPDNPAGWIVTTARNRAIDLVRRSRRRRELTEQIAADRLRAETTAAAEDPEPMHDDQLRRRSSPVATRPSASNTRWRSTLRLIGGLTPAEVASAFLVSEDTMAKRRCAPSTRSRRPTSPTGSRRGRTARSSACGAHGAVPDLQRRRGRRRAPRPESRGHQADSDAGVSHARRARGGGPPGPPHPERRTDAGPRRRSPTSC